MSEGVDISEFQDHVPDCEFVIVRGWSGYRQDNRFVQHWADAKARGIPRGVYGYVVENNPVGQADALMALVAGDPPELGYWSDIEEPGLSHDAAMAHINRLRSTRRNGFYSNVPDYHGILNDDDSLADLPWWVAGYGPNDGNRHDLNPAPPRPYTIHQYTSYPALDRNYAENLNWWGPPHPDSGDDMISMCYDAKRKAMVAMAPNGAGQVFWSERVLGGTWSPWTEVAEGAFALPVKSV